MHPPFRERERRLWRTAPCEEAPCPLERLRWHPPAIPDAPSDFLEGLATFATGGDARLGCGVGIHIYTCNRPMTRRAFYDADGELLVVPEQGALGLVTEFGRLDAAPGEIAVIPRGIKFRVDVTGAARGYVLENYGVPLRLPELGPIGANGLASPRDFEVPVAAIEDEAPTVVVGKFRARLWEAAFEHSPFDVVAWHGNYYPYKYDLARFNTINTVSFDHPDPSIFTVLSSPSERPGTANVDFVIFPPRWLVAEDTFRPPYFHRNVMSEFMGLVRGEYDAKRGGFVPGGASLHNALTAHGPDLASYEAGATAESTPRYLADTLAFMFESRYVLDPTGFALETPIRDREYEQVWQGFSARHRP